LLDSGIVAEMRGRESVADCCRAIGSVCLLEEFIFREVVDGNIPVIIFFSFP